MLTNGPQAERFLEALDDEKSLIVPSITVLKCSSGFCVNTARRIYSMDADFKGLADVELILKMC